MTTEAAKSASARRAAEWRAAQKKSRGEAPNGPKDSLPDPLDPSPLVAQLLATIASKDALIATLVERVCTLGDAFAMFANKPNMFANAGERPQPKTALDAPSGSVTHQVAPPLRAPARARQSESYSPDSLTLSQDPKHRAGETSQDRNGAHTGTDEAFASVREQLRTKPNAFANGANSEPEYANAVRTEPTSFLNSREGGEGDPEPDPWGLNGGIPSPPSLTRTFPPEFDAAKYEAARAAQLRAAEEKAAAWDREDREKQNGRQP